jgi:glycosyltransferase involved in cell wall biosynthesis
MQTKKIAIIGSVGLPAKYGGWETLVHNLSLELSNIFQLTVFCSSRRYEKKINFFNGARLEYINLNANGIQSIPYDIISIYKAFKFADTVLILGVSGCIALPIFRLFGTTKVIVNIDGLEWKREKWGRFTKIFLKISEKCAVKFSHIVVTDNKALQSYVLETYGVESHFIAYGGNHAAKVEKNLHYLNKYKFLADKYAFKVCRIERENNIELILKAFREANFLNLVLVGNWHGNSFGKALFKEYGNDTNLFLLDPIYDYNEINVLRSNCFVYIHGHSAGGTNPSLVEAMNLELPIISYDVDFNRNTTENKSLYFKNQEQLVDILNNLNNINLIEVSKELKLIAEKNYNWSKISKQYSKLF